MLAARTGLLAACVVLAGCGSEPNTPAPEPTPAPSDPTEAAAPAPVLRAPTDPELLDRQREMWAAAEQASCLVTEGRIEEAFLRYLEIPGAEHVARDLVRPQAAAAIPWVAAAASRGSRAAELVLGDLLLAVGDHAGALDRYRSYALAVDPAGYPVEPPPDRGRGSAWGPFTVGPGSHRDNWLVRRFIALEEMTGAACELARVQAIHVARAGSGQLDGMGLLFALDHSYFLKRTGRAEESRRMLLEALVRMDMDRNPEAPETRPALIPRGISRAELLRLAQGAFASEGRLGDLENALRDEIVAGHSRARRVLARVRLHQGDTEGSLALELEHIQLGGFDEASRNLRSALVYDAHGKLAEAEAAYARALSSSLANVDLPDEDEEAQEGRASAARVIVGPMTERQVRSIMTERQLHVLGALGRDADAAALLLRRLEEDASKAANFSEVQRAADAFAARGEQARFAAWARERIAAAPSAEAQANFAWFGGDLDAARAAVLRISSESPDHFSLPQWTERFRAKGAAEHEKLIRLLGTEDAPGAAARLKVLALEKRLDSVDAMKAMEVLLDAPTLPPLAYEGGQFQQFHSATYHPELFSNRLDLAYRLMQLYERLGRLDALRSLGLRIAERKIPDLQWTGASRMTGLGNGPWQDLQASLALVIQHADEPTLAALARVIDPASPEGRQLARRRGQGAPAPRKPFPWANVPRTAVPRTSLENVLSLAVDERHVYAGMPWGVAVYDRDGSPVTRIALGDAAIDMAVSGSTVWAAGATELFHVTPGSWSTARIPVRDALPPSRPGERILSALAPEEGGIWVGARGGLLRIDDGGEEITCYQPGDPLARRPVSWDRILTGDHDVWLSGGGACLRFDRETRTFTPAEAPEAEALALVARDGERIWGTATVPGVGERPWSADSGSTEVTLLALRQSTAPPIQEPESTIHGVALVFVGPWRGAPVFAARGHQVVRFFTPEPGSGTLTELSTSDWPLLGVLAPELGSGTPFHRGDGVVSGKRYSRPWRAALDEDGSMVLGRTHREGALDSRNDSGEEPSEGGLFVTRSGATRRVSSEAGDLPGDWVYDVFADGDRRWVCTSGGIAGVDSDDGTDAWYTADDGLIANRIVGGALFDGRLYFAGGFGDAGGGLHLYDPATRVFTAMLRSEGLATDKLAGLRVEGEDLVIQYDAHVVGYPENKQLRHPPARLAKGTGTITSGGEPEVVPFTRASDREPARDAPRLALLGGAVLGERTVAGRRFVLGTRGMVETAGEEVPSPGLTERSPRIRQDETAAEVAEAQALAMPQPFTIRDLEALCASGNPFVRAKALAALYSLDHPQTRTASGEAEDSARRASLAVVVKAARDPDIVVRSTAVKLLADSKDESLHQALERALVDPNLGIRCVAAVGLCRRGRPPGATIIERCLEPHSIVVSFGLRAASVDRREIHAALAASAGAEHLVLLPRYPPDYDLDSLGNVLQELGAALRRHPEVLPELLQVHAPERGHDRQADYVERVIGAGGTVFVPALHEALRSPDRVVRSNAARACGRIRDSSSVEPLLAALDLESGLSRAAIVKALGLLGSPEALPALAQLYIDASNDEKRRAGAGHRMSQAGAALDSQYETIGRLEALDQEWDEIQASLKPPPLDPPQDEPLLSTRAILDTVAAIGPEHSQSFYRKLAGTGDVEARCEAARRLRDGTGSDATANLPVLRSMLSDEAVSVQVCAALSLLTMGEKGMEPRIRRWVEIGMRELVTREVKALPPDKRARAEPLVAAAGVERATPTAGHTPDRR